MISSLREQLLRLLLKLPVLRYLNYRIEHLSSSLNELSERMSDMKQVQIRHDEIVRTESLIGMPQEILDAQDRSGRSDDFFKHLEHQYRGDFEEVLQGLECFSSLLDTIPSGSTVVDLGCGRGEWLSFLSARGVDAVGVDLNAEKVAHARSQGYKADCADAITFLASLDQKVGMISMFHVVEHLPLNYLIAVFDLAFSKLADGGVLLMEMPNVGHEGVSKLGFYMDPSHRKPIPPQLLAFMAQNSGLKDTELLFLNKVQVDGRPTRVVLNQDEGAQLCADVALVARKNDIQSGS